MAAFPARIDRRVALGATCWAAAIVFFAGQAVAESTSARPYSLTTNLISDLGNTTCGPVVCSPLHFVMNATFVATGLLHWGGAVALYLVWPDDLRRNLVTVLLSVAGWGLAYAGVFPEDLAPINHEFGALLGLVALNLGMLTAGWALYNSVRGLGILAGLVGALGLAGLALFLLHGSEPTLPAGITERMADYPGAAMFVVLGVFILVKTRNATQLRTDPGHRR